MAGPLEPEYVERLATAIYWAEGGPKAKPAYGIKSVPVKDAEEARQVCCNTIRNNWDRWQAAGRPVDFIEFLGRRYCPPGADPQGHANWISNVRYFLANPKPLHTHEYWTVVFRPQGSHHFTPAAGQYKTYALHDYTPWLTRRESAQTLANELMSRYPLLEFRVARVEVKLEDP